MLALVLVFTHFTTDPLEIDAQRVVDDMATPGVATSIEWKDCGETNAYYSPDTRKITMCNELRGLNPAVIDGIAAHEMAHAIICQLDLPITGEDEFAADELSFLAMAETGRVNELYTLSRFYGTGPFSGSEENPLDPHPGDMRRAANARRVADGALGKNLVSVLRFTEIADRWHRLILSVD